MCVNEEQVEITKLDQKYILDGRFFFSRVGLRIGLQNAETQIAKTEKDMRTVFVRPYRIVTPHCWLRYLDRGRLDA